jgi:hypothetical protein
LNLSQTAALVAAASLVAGCASITDGTDQTLIIPVQPKEARCSVMRSDVELGTITGTQQTLTISKGAKDIIVTCNAPGYLQKVSRLVSTTQTSGMMSFLFLDLGITDMVTGAMWKYPQSTSIILERDPAYVPAAGAAPIPPAGPPPGATVNVDVNAGAMPAPPPSARMWWSPRSWHASWAARRAIPWASCWARVRARRPTVSSAPTVRPCRTLRVRELPTA